MQCLMASLRFAGETTFGCAHQPQGRVSGNTLNIVKDEAMCVCKIADCNVKELPLTTAKTTEHGGGDPGPPSSVTITQSGDWQWRMESDVAGIVSGGDGMAAPNFPMLTIKQGTEVTFLGSVLSSHNFAVAVVEAAGLAPNAVVVGPTKIADGDAVDFELTWTAAVAGTYKYVCEPHASFMKGTIVVVVAEDAPKNVNAGNGTADGEGANDAGENENNRKDNEGVGGADTSGGNASNTSDANVATNVTVSESKTGISAGAAVVVVLAVIALLAVGSYVGYKYHTRSAAGTRRDGGASYENPTYSRDGTVAANAGGAAVDAFVITPNNAGIRLVSLSGKPRTKPKGNGASNITMPPISSI